jgi:hypothetical protein
MNIWIKTSLFSTLLVVAQSYSYAGEEALLVECPQGTVLVSTDKGRYSSASGYSEAQVLMLGERAVFSVDTPDGDSIILDAKLDRQRSTGVDVSVFTHKSEVDNSKVDTISIKNMHKRAYQIEVMHSMYSSKPTLLEINMKYSCNISA